MRVGRNLIIVIVVLAGLLALDRLGILGPVRSALSYFVTPLQLGWYRLEQGTGDRLSVIAHVGTLGDDNLKLRADNDKLKAQLATLGQVQSENKALRDQIGTPQTTGFKLLMAQTLGYIPDVGTKEILLSEGSNSGVKTSQVVVSGSVILGRVIRVTADRSTVRLLTDPQTKVLVVTVNGAKGILVGQFQSSLELTKVLPGDSLNIGDQVVATGEEGWPKGMVIGEVTKVSRTEGELFQQADVRPLVSYDSLQTVFIITGVK